MNGPIRETARRRPRQRWLIVWTIAAVVMSACAAALPYLDIRGIATIPVAQALVPVGAVALLLLAITSLAFRAWVGALVFLAGATISGAPTLTPLHVGKECESDLPLTVLSFNAKLSGVDPAALSTLIRTTEPDIVVLLETDETLIDAMLGDHGLSHRTRCRRRSNSERFWRSKSERLRAV